MDENETRDLEFVKCLDCGHEQADMGTGVACEECGALMPSSSEG